MWYFYFKSMIGLDDFSTAAAVAMAAAFFSRVHSSLFIFSDVISVSFSKWNFAESISFGRWQQYYFRFSSSCFILIKDQNLSFIIEYDTHTYI